MKAGIIIRIAAGLALVIVLALVCVKLLDMMGGAVVNLLSGDSTPGGFDEQVMLTPEPMPTMPAYMGEDSFYDNAGSVVFDDE